MPWLQLFDCSQSIESERRSLDSRTNCDKMIEKQGRERIRVVNRYTMMRMSSMRGIFSVLFVQ